MTTKRLLASFAAAALLLGCLGGQSNQAKQQSSRVGDRSGEIPKSMLGERDWKEAAQGHGAAGVIPPEDLARMDEKSAPGGATRPKP